VLKREDVKRDQGDGFDHVFLFDGVAGRGSSVETGVGPACRLPAGFYRTRGYVGIYRDFS